MLFAIPASLFCAIGFCYKGMQGSRRLRKLMCFDFLQIEAKARISRLADTQKEIRADKTYACFSMMSASATLRPSAIKML